MTFFFFFLKIFLKIYFKVVVIHIQITSISDNNNASIMEIYKEVY